MSAAVTWLAEALAQSGLTIEERIRTLGLLGGFCRILGRLDEATTHLKAALALAREAGNAQAALANQIRLAHVYQWQREFERADALYVGAIRACGRDAGLAIYLDFALQHYGKSKFDQGDYALAVECFTQALTLRERRNAPEDQLASTRLALATARQRLETGRAGLAYGYDDHASDDSAARISS